MEKLYSFTILNSSQFYGHHATHFFSNGYIARYIVEGKNERFCLKLGLTPILELNEGVMAQWVCFGGDSNAEGQNEALVSDGSVVYFGGDSNGVVFNPWDD